MTLPRVLPVAVIEDAAHAVPLARALVAGGLPAIEVTFRTAAAADSIAKIAADVPGMDLGAGTVLTVEQANTAIGCGAKFVVSPGLSRPVVDHCRSRGVPVYPGVITPTEIMAALDAGLDTLKFFPAEAAGGVKYLKSVAAPFRNVKFIPTGGIDASNLAAYLALPFVVACGGSWMVKPELIAAGRYDEITRLSAEAARLAGKP